MNVLDWIILTGSGIALAIVIGYALWVPIRVLSLQADLLEIYAETYLKIAKLDALNDKAYVEVRAGIPAMLRQADLFSVPVMLYLSGIGPRKVFPTSLPVSDDLRVQLVMDWAISAASLRLADYLIYETLTGRILWLLMRFLPRRVAKQEIQNGAAGLMERMRMVHHSMPVGSC
ncbi:MAG TPA: hypothetical protein DDY78_14080 [Planctomycetales bacterium]|jgi:hypothetical protein|nr:hypothetical protein [Planctomycetales bacterium]